MVAKGKKQAIPFGAQKAYFQELLLMEEIAPPGMYKTLWIVGYTTNLNWLAGFLPSTGC